MSTASTRGRTCLSGLMNGGSQLLDALVDCLLVVYRGIPQKSVLKASLECRPVHSRDVLKG
jgi:hypothetical protein